MTIVIKAQNLAHEAHKGQVRRYSGMPYIVNPASVAAVARAYRLGDIVIAASWTHDVVEDTYFSIDDIYHELGSSVADLVSELTNPSKGHPELSREKRKAMDREHLAVVSDDAKRIKLIDRIDNLRNIIVEAKPSFAKQYLHESVLLAQVLKDVHSDLETHLQETIEFGWDYLSD